MNETFSERCYAILRSVPKGRVTTYRELAHAMGTKAYRAIGNAMNRNPYAPEVPCHRVVSTSGELGGFAHGSKRKIAMLEAEGVRVKNGRILEFDQVFFPISGTRKKRKR